MASIFGLKLKGRRTFEGRDWQGNQGNLYIGNKKIAWFNDSGDGGAADIDFYGERQEREQYEKQLDEIVKQYYAKHPMTGEYADLTPDVELLIGKLIELMDDEKQYKKYAKQGYPVMIIYRKTEYGMSYYYAFRTSEAAEKWIKKENPIVLNRYDSADDFDIKG